MTEPKRKARLLVIIDGGMVETIAVEGLLDIELELVKIDLDIDGAEEADGLIRVDGNEMIVTVEEVALMTPLEAALARNARDTWALS